MKRYGNRKTFVVRRKEVSLNEFQAEIVYWKKVAVIKGGCLDLIDGEMVAKAGRMVESSTHFMVSSIGDVRMDDRVSCDGKDYKVTFVYNPMELNHHLEVELELLTTENRKPTNMIYWGVSADAMLNAEQVLALHSKEVSTKTLNETLIPVDEYIYFAYPADLGNATVRMNDLIDMDFEVSEVVINGINHYLYRSEDQLDGEQNIQVM